MKKWYLVSGLVVAVVVTTIFVSSYYFRGSEQVGRSTVTLGAILPMTGDALNYGELMKQGIAIAVDEFNARGESIPAPRCDH